MPEQPADRDSTKAHIETRISLVLYGGVSLAVYINGVCQELLQVVRATSRKTLENRCEDGPVYEMSAVEREYARIACEHRRRVVVDVMSGTSAGGLNAVYLSKALAQGLPLDALTKVWFEEGDLERLINDEQAELPADEARPGVKATREPKSLLSGDRFELLLLRALQDMDDSDVKLGPLVDAIDCYLTTTDLRGIPERIELASGPITEPRRRARFHFRRGTRETTGRNDQDFNDNDHLLAFAARATAAHPAAFQPAQWNHTTELGNSPGVGLGALEDYLSPSRNESGKVDLDSRWYSDGGDMDNKPFSYALEPLARRRADRPIDRRVLYVEPDPAGDDNTWDDVALPSLSAYTIGTYGLGRTENIRQDIESIGERNEAVKRITHALDSLLDRTPTQVIDSIRNRIGYADGDGHWDQLLEGKSITEVALFRKYNSDGTTDCCASGGDAAADGQRPSERSVVAGWAERTRDESIEQEGWAAIGLEQFRFRAVLRKLIVAALQVGDAEPSPRAVATLEPLVEKRALAWAKRRAPSSVHQHQRHLLMSLDISYRLRRLTLLEYILGFEQRELLADSTLADDEPRFKGCRELRHEINTIYLELNSLFDELTRHDFGLIGPDRKEADIIAELKEADRCNEAEEGNQAEKLNELDHLFDEATNRVRLHLSDASRRGREAIRDADLGDNAEILRNKLVDAWINYDQYDQLLLPLEDLVEGELQPAEVLRVSPLDSTALVDEGSTISRRRKLGGNSLGHFGGFVDADWRLNDILWGRLDAAETIVRHVLMPGKPDTEIAPEIARVHRALLADEAMAIIRAREKACLEPGEPSTASSCLVSLLNVNAWSAGVRHCAARAALAELECKGETEIGNVVDAFHALLTAPTGWTIDMSGRGRRRVAKSVIYNRAVNVFGRVLAHHAHDPYTPGGARAPRRSMQFIGRVIADLVVAALPQAGSEPLRKRLLARTVRWFVYPLLVLVSVRGAVFAFVNESWRASSLLVGALGLGALASYLRIRRTGGWLWRIGLTLCSMAGLGAAVTAFVIDPGAAALTTLSVFALVATLMVGFVAVPALGGVLVTTGHRYDLPPEPWS